MVGSIFWSTGALVATVGAFVASTEPLRLALGAAAVVTARMAVRSRTAGVTVTTAGLVVTGWVRTYRIALADVVAVDVVPYTGMLGGRDVHRAFRMPRIRRRGGPDVYVESLMGTPERVEDIVAILDEAVS